MGDEEREVAVKSLADDSTEDKRIQFLQEAVIMGQFKHPNVITLHGVLTENDLVSINKLKQVHFISFFVQILVVVEIMHKGDLRSRLLSIKPK